MTNTKKCFTCDQELSEEFDHDCPFDGQRLGEGTKQLIESLKRGYEHEQDA